MIHSSRIRSYLIYTKPRVWILLVYVAAIGGVIAAPNHSFSTLALIILAVIATVLGSAGAEAVTNYIDRNIDSKMSRTRNRPIPTGVIEPRNGLYFGFALILFSIIVLLLFSRFLAALFMILGVFDNVYIYSYLLKKKSPWSIVLGGFSGGFPVLIGWYTVTSAFSVLPWFLFALVVIWIPVHIWSIAYRYREDYQNAKVPMLPAIYPERISSICISGSALILIIVSLIPIFIEKQSIYFVLALVVVSLPLIALSISFMMHPSKERSFRLFKYSNPYLAFVFFLFMIFAVF